MPCNWNQRELARHVRRGIIEAGGTPVEFNTIAVSDGVLDGYRGACARRSSRARRSPIRSSSSCAGTCSTVLVCLGSAATRRFRQPRWRSRGSTCRGSILYNGSIAPGRFRGRDVTIQDVFEAVGAAAAGTMTNADVHELESVACPGAGACGGPVHRQHDGDALEFLGISPAGLNDVPATDPAKHDAAYEAGKVAMRLVRDGRASVPDHDARRARERTPSRA